MDALVRAFYILFFLIEYFSINLLIVYFLPKDFKDIILQHWRVETYHYHLGIEEFFT